MALPFVSDGASQLKSTSRTSAVVVATKFNGADDIRDIVTFGLFDPKLSPTAFVE